MRYYRGTARNCVAVGIASAAALWLIGCTTAELNAIDPPKMGYVDPTTHCPRYEHNVRGPDAYDRAHGLPYHCEKPQWDAENSDIDPTAE